MRRTAPGHRGEGALRGRALPDRQAEEAEGVGGQGMRLLVGQRTGGAAAVHAQAHAHGLGAQHVATGIAGHGLEVEGLRYLRHEGATQQGGDQKAGEAHDSSVQGSGWARTVVGTVPPMLRRMGSRSLSAPV